jgi:hypothetical protein
MARVYGCDNCGYESEDVTEILLMADGSTEYCAPCYKGMNHGNQEG